MKPSTKKSLSLCACLLLAFVRGLFIDSVPSDSPFSWLVEFFFASAYIGLCMNWFLVDGSLHGMTFTQLKPRLLFARASMLKFPRYFSRTRGKLGWKLTLVTAAFLPISFCVMFLGAIIVPVIKIAWYWYNK